MNTMHHFKNMDASESMMTYCEHRLEKIERHLIHESEFEVRYSKEGIHFFAQIEIKNPRQRFRAKGRGSTWMEAIDDMVARLDHQVVKYKEQVQNHKKYERSRQGRLERVNARLEFDVTGLPIRKVS